MPATVRIWDLPTRLFHWLFALCVTGSLATAWVGGLWMDWHLRLGYVALGLLAFRLAWGFIGPRHARFASFVRGPRTLMAYLRGDDVASGHSPLGALSVVAMLAVFGAQVATGLFADDGIFTSGPLAARVDTATSDWLTGWHQRLEPVLYALIALHLAAIAWYAGVRRRGLVRAMITGDKPTAQVPAGTEPAADSRAVLLRALLLAGLCAAAVTWLVRWGAAGGF